MTLPKKRLSQDLPDVLPPNAKRKTSTADVPDQRLEAYARLASAADVPRPHLEVCTQLEADERRRQQQLLQRLNNMSPAAFFPSPSTLPPRNNPIYGSTTWALAPPSIVTPCATPPNEVAIPSVPVQGSTPDSRSLPMPPLRRTGDSSETAAAAGAGNIRNPLEMLSTLSSLVGPASHRPRQPAAAPLARAPPREHPRGNVFHRKHPAPSPEDNRGIKSHREAGHNTSPRDPEDIKSPRDHKVNSLPDPEGGDECYVGERCPTTGLRHGRGIMKYPNGSRYVGCFSQGRRHGFGKVWYPSDRGVYTGRWRQNKKHGKGTMHYANKDVYEGRWEDDLPHGEGKLTMVGRGEVFEGGFSKKMKHGWGVYRLSNGDVYKGGWKDDVRHGAGVLISASGEVQQRMYYQGILIHPPL